MRAAARWADWILFYLGPLWLAACIVVAASRMLGLRWPKRIAAVPIALVVIAAPLLSADFSGSLWTAGRGERDDGITPASVAAVASEDVLYLQPKLLEHELAALLPRRDGRPNLYLVGVAGYGSQNVFRREVDYVDELFAERFGTRGRSIKLINNAATVRETPIATRTSLSETLKRVGALMKPDEDVLWMPGYWHWDDDRDDFLWVSGIWRTPPPNKRWVAGYWREEEQGAVWVGGFWTESTTTARLGSSTGGAGVDVNFEDTLGLEERKWVGELGAYWRISQRWRLDVDYVHRTSDEGIAELADSIAEAAGSSLEDDGRDDRPVYWVPVAGVLVLVAWQMAASIAELSASLAMVAPARRRRREPGIDPAATPTPSASTPADDRSAA